MVQTFGGEEDERKTELLFVQQRDLQSELRSGTLIDAPD